MRNFKHNPRKQKEQIVFKKNEKLFKRKVDNSIYHQQLSPSDSFYIAVTIIGMSLLFLLHNLLN